MNTILYMVEWQSLEDEQEEFQETVFLELGEAQEFTYNIFKDRPQEIKLYCVEMTESDRELIQTMHMTRKEE
jgi:hypothetical protein